MKLVEKYGWRKVEAPQAWRPQDLGDELIGYYGGRTVRQGQYGQYEVVLIHVPYKGAFTITGSQLIRLIDAACITVTHPIRVQWLGSRPTVNGKTEKQFSLMVADLEHVSESDLPEVST